MFYVGQKVKAKICLVDDYTEDGLGSLVCANAGDALIIRKVRGHGRFEVSHEHITDRSFIATDGELEAVQRSE